MKALLLARVWEPGWESTLKRYQNAYENWW